METATAGGTAATAAVPWGEKKDGQAEDGLGPNGSRLREQNETVASQQPPTKEEAKTTAVWQFRYRRYRLVLPWKDDEAPETPSGIVPAECIEARNWRAVLDLTNTGHKKVHEHLLEDPQRGHDFWLLEGVKETDSIVERAETLGELFKMNIHQLSNMLTPQEKESLGLPSNCQNQMQLVMAVIDNKKLAKKEE